MPINFQYYGFILYTTKLNLEVVNKTLNVYGVRDRGYIFLTSGPFLVSLYRVNSIPQPCQCLREDTRVYNGHRFEIGIFNPRDDRAGWYRGSAEVPHGPVIPSIENDDLKLMPIIDSFSCIPYRFFFLHTTTFYDQFKCIFAVYLVIYIFSNHFFGYHEC